MNSKLFYIIFITIDLILILNNIGYCVNALFDYELNETQITDENKSEEEEEVILTRQLMTGRLPRQNLPQLTCICVAPGTCPRNGSTDGSGLIDVRIVNPLQVTTGAPPLQCQYGLETCCLPGPYQCGVRYPPVPRSPNPAPVQSAFGAYPWQAVILTLDEAYLGSGALIDQRHILTVAHKVNNLPLNSFKIRLGEWDAAATNEPIPAQEFSVSRVFIHPNFNPNNLQNDVAILRLSTDVKLGQTPTIATICLPAGMFVGSRCFVAGWGKDDFGPSGKYQAIQRDVDVQVQSQQFCQSSLSKTRLGPQFIFNTTSFICAGGEPGKDACTGDGGSPLVCEVNRKWYVTGLVAWGINCATGGVPGVYVNVLSYISWIRSTISS